MTTAKARLDPDDGISYLQPSLSAGAEASSIKKRPVFFLVNTTGLFDELFRLAKLLLANGIEPIFYFAFEHWTVERDIQRCRAAGIRVVVDDPIDASAMFPRLKRVRDFFGRRSSWPFAVVLFGFLSDLISLRLSIARATRLYSLTGAQLLILSIDLVGYDSCAYVKAAHDRGIKALVVSSAMSKGLDVAEVHYHDPKFHIVDAVQKTIAKLFPTWVLLHRGRKLLRVQPHRILAMKMLDLDPPGPWLFNGSRADVVTAESPAMADYNAAAGMAREQMRGVGSTADDLLAEAFADQENRRKELCRSLALSPDRPIILTALPPDFLYVSGGRPECDFRDYKSLVEFWVKSLCSVGGYNVIIAMHPSAKSDDMLALERHGARIAPLVTPDLIPLCDFFVASVSSTIRWAIACGKPVLNYDVYRYRYVDDFGAVGGVLTIEEQSDFLAALSRFTQDKEFFRQMQMKQGAVSKQWGFLDGNCGARMVGLVNELLPAVSNLHLFTAPSADIRHEITSAEAGHNATAIPAWSPTELSVSLSSRGTEARIPSAIIAAALMLLALLSLLAGLFTEGYAGGRSMLRRLMGRMLHLLRRALGIFAR